MTGTIAGPATELATATAKRVGRALGRFRVDAGLIHLRWRNLVSREPVTGAADVVVSMTSFGDRLRTVDLALESIARGTVKPRRLILWLDDPDAMAFLPPEVERLRLRGLEVRLSQSFGSHTKYFPYVASNGHSGSPLVTADDDTIYPDTWLQGLLEANEAEPGMIHGYGVRAISVNGGTITGYQDWARRHDTEPGFNNVALGASGVIYPARMLRELKARGDLFMDVCPGADDIWLHWVALRAGIPVCQVDSVARDFPTIPGTQAEALSVVNVGGNDHSIRTLYSTADVAALMAPNHGSLQHYPVVWSGPAV